ncbi:hypothetical protein [Nitrososphaera sp. AFS]|uniref:hypothetical protein n=1 Tax=Nitrososphaera sp. AFS TaxID=2301191 RepID=UPI001392232C|nr:hypothetical protein [Nitrososphaera sp. AFS]
MSFVIATSKILGDYLTFSSAPPKLYLSCTGKNQNANAAAAFQRSWRGSLAINVSKTFRQGLKLQRITKLAPELSAIFK